MAMAQAASGKRRSFYADLDHLRSHFDSLDQSKTGYIGYSELKQLVQKMSDIEEAVLPELMEKLDRDNDGKVSFDDFQALFEVERETTSKKIKISNPDNPPNKSDYGLDGPPMTETMLSPTSAYRSLPEKTRSGRVLPETPTVILRHKRPQRRDDDRQFGLLSPIHAGSTSNRGRPPSNELPDLATQMQYLTGLDATDSASPQVKRSSRVLSWINESEDFMLEDTGDGLHFKGLDNTDELPSPPMSPTRGHEEASHVATILESVLHCKHIDKEAIAKLCAHVNADPQEEEELLSLLHHLDKKNVGSVSLEDFVRGLQAVKNAAQVASTPFVSPPHQPPPRRHTISGQSIPRLSEPFSTPVHKLSSTPLASTPLGVQPANSNIILSVLDPDNSGYIKVDSLVDQIQQMGVEAGHNSSLEEAVAEAVTVDPTGRVSVTEFTSSLEGAILTEGKTNNFLRQIALKSFRSEISTLRTQVNQISLERDTLKHSLNRTVDEKKKLVQEGEEHVDMVTKQSDMKLKEQEYELTKRLKDTERLRQEEQLQIQERVSAVIADFEQKVEKLKADEERLRADRKLAEDEVNFVTSQLNKAHRELSQKDQLISTLRQDLDSRSDLDLEDDEHQLTRIQELENVITDKGTFISELQEKLRDTQDRFDLLTAENEKMKQKYLSAKRDLQRRKGSARLTRKNSSDGKSRPLSGTHFGRNQKPKRPLSGSHFGRSTPIKPRIMKSPLDLAIGEESNHPVLFEDIDGPSSEYSEPASPTEGQDIEEEFLTQQALDLVDVGDMPTASSGSTTPTETESGEDDLFSRSTASLMDEIHHQEQRSLLETKIKQLEEDRQKLEAQYQKLELQIKNSEEGDRNDMLRELERTKQKQQELDRLINTLTKQSKRLSKTKMEIDSKLQVAEQSLARQLQGLRSSLTDNSGTESTGHLTDLIEELETLRDQLETERKTHDDSITSLKGQLSQAEEYSDTQTDQSLKLEEEKAQIEDELIAAQQTLESERRAHEAEVNILMQKLDNAEQSITRLEQNHGESLLQAKQELERARTEVQQYQQETEALRAQLNDAEENLSAKKIETIIEVTEIPPTRPSSMDSANQTDTTDDEALTKIELDRLRKSLKETQDERVKVTEQNEHLQTALELHEAKMLIAEQSKKEEISSLQNQLSECQAEIEQLLTANKEQLLRTTELQVELEECSKKAEAQITETSSTYLKRIEKSKVEYEMQLKKIINELNASHNSEKQLQDKLSRVGSQCENALTEVAEISMRESEYQVQIAVLKESESQLKHTISQLSTDIKKYQDELAQFHLAESKQAANVDEQPLMKTPTKSPKKHRSFDETDFIPAPIFNPRKLSFSSEHDSQEKIIIQMKDQLEELQRILVLQTKKGKRSEGDAELSLVQELLASNEALDAEARRAKQAFADEQERLSEVLSTKDKLFSELHLQMKSEKNEIQTLALATARDIFGQFSRFNESSDECLSNYKLRVEEASLKVASISTALKGRDDKHLSALDDMVSDLDHSRVECDSYREEIDRLKHELDQSQKGIDNLNQSREDALHLQRMTQTEVDQLQSQLRLSQQMRKDTVSTSTSSAQASLASGPDSRRVDEESGQIFHSQGEPDELSYKDSILLVQKEEEIRNLREELEKVRRLERLTRSKSEEMEGQVNNRERLLQEKEDEAKSREKRIQELESDLHGIVNEHVESVVQYVEVQPLESVNEALLLNMRQDVPRVKPVEEMQQQKQVETQAAVDSSNPDGEHVSEMALALQEAEGKLLAFKEVEETLKLQHQQTIQEIETKYEAELSITNDVIEEHTHNLRELYVSVVEKEVDQERIQLLTHSQLIGEVGREVQRLKSELANQQSIVCEMEATLTRKMDEHDQLETQIQTEHDEEVKALHQQKQQLIRQLDEANMHYHRTIKEQDQYSNVLVQDILNAKSAIEKQLRQKTEESLLAYQRVGDLMEEKKVLMDIIEQLCIEAGKQIDVV